MPALESSGWEPVSEGVLGWQHDFTHQLLYKHHEVWLPIL